MDETVTPLKFSVEGEAAAVHKGVQAEDRARSRWVQDAGRDRRVVTARGAVFLAPDDVARSARARRAGRRTEEAWASAAGCRSARQEARRTRTGTEPVEEARRAG